MMLILTLQCLLLLCLLIPSAEGLSKLTEYTQKHGEIKRLSYNPPVSAKYLNMPNLPQQTPKDNLGEMKCCVVPDEESKGVIYCLAHDCAKFNGVRYKVGLEDLKDPSQCPSLERCPLESSATKADILYRDKMTKRFAIMAKNFDRYKNQMEKWANSLERSCQGQVQKVRDKLDLAQDNLAHCQAQFHKLTVQYTALEAIVKKLQETPGSLTDEDVDALKRMNLVVTSDLQIPTGQ